MKTAKKIALGVLIFVLIQVLNQFLGISGSVLERSLPVPNPKFFVGIYQQIVQALTGILLYGAFFKKGMRKLGINNQNARISLAWFGGFALIWLAIISLYVVAAYYFAPATWAAMKGAEVPNFQALAATVAFQAVFPGLGEEILFRGLIIGCLTAWVFPAYEDRVASKLGILVLSSIYFAVAHIYFSLAPLRLTHIDALQLASALGCGIFYTLATLRTRSLLAPILAHNFANTSATLCGVIIAMQ